MAPDDNAPVTFSQIKPLIDDMKIVKEAIRGSDDGEKDGIMHRLRTLEGESKRRGQILAVIGVALIGLMVKDGYNAFIRAAAPATTSTTNTTTTNNAAPAAHSP